MFLFLFKHFFFYSSHHNQTSKRRNFHLWDYQLLPFLEFSQVSVWFPREINYIRMLNSSPLNETSLLIHNLLNTVKSCDWHFDHSTITVTQIERREETTQSGTNQRLIYEKCLHKSLCVWFDLSNHKHVVTENSNILNILHSSYE